MNGPKRQCTVACRHTTISANHRYPLDTGYYMLGDTAFAIQDKQRQIPQILDRNFPLSRVVGVLSCFVKGVAMPRAPLGIYYYCSLSTGNSRTHAYRRLAKTQFLSCELQGRHMNNIQPPPPNRELLGDTSNKTLQWSDHQA